MLVVVEQRLRVVLYVCISSLSVNMGVLVVICVVFTVGLQAVIGSLFSHDPLSECWLVGWVGGWVVLPLSTLLSPLCPPLPSLPHSPLIVCSSSPIPTFFLLFSLFLFHTVSSLLSIFFSPLLPQVPLGNLPQRNNTTGK